MQFLPFLYIFQLILSKSWNSKIYHFLRYILSNEKGVQCFCFLNFISDKTVFGKSWDIVWFHWSFCIFLYMYEYITLSHWRRSACWDSYFRCPEVGEMRPHSWITSSSYGDRKIFLSATVGEQSYPQQLGNRVIRNSWGKCSPQQLGKRIGMYRGAKKVQ